MVSTFMAPTKEAAFQILSIMDSGLGEFETNVGVVAIRCEDPATCKVSRIKQLNQRSSLAFISRHSSPLTVYYI